MNIKEIEVLKEEREALSSKEHLSSEERFRLAWLTETLENMQRRADQMRSRLGARFQSRTFENFDEGENAEAKRACEDFSREYKGNARNGLIIAGGYGRGKTHLAAAIANRLIDEGIPIMFDTYAGYLERLKGEFGEKDRHYLDNMCETPVLFIDDIGNEKQSEWSETVLYEVINTRYENCLPIVITTNFRGNELLDLLGGATYSRLCEMCRLVGVKGEDRRRTSARENTIRG